MKSYKEYETIDLGSSPCKELDISYKYAIGLLINSGLSTLCFDSEGPYKAYIVDEGAIIADHYWRTLGFSSPEGGCVSIKIHNDGECVYISPRCREIDIYRAGKKVCIIQLRRLYDDIV